jgi:hypothetical protein
MSVDTKDALDAALWMASYGYQIWPCRIQLNAKGKKDPKKLPEHWTEGGLTDPEAIKAQWMAVRATGYMISCGPSRVTVIDTDIKPGVDGNQNYLNAGGANEAGFIVQTWSGGWHRYHQSSGFGCKHGNPPGVDVKGIGGGVFGPGSIVLNQQGNFAGQYGVNFGTPHRSGLTPEPQNLPFITGAPRAFPSKSDADAFFAERDQYPPLTRSRASQAVANKVAELENMKNKSGTGMRYRIMGAALLLGGVMHADLGYDENDARDVLIKACDKAYALVGGHDTEDEEWIASGLADGQLKKPIPVYPDPLPPEQADPFNTSGYVAGSDDRIVDLAPYLDGTYQPPEPNIGARREYDRVQMIYPSRWHTVVGLTESGKSLFAVWQSVSVIRDGGLVVYLHFEETDPRGTLERMRNFGQPLGIDTDTIRKQFVWMNCETKWDEGSFAQALLKLPAAPTLVVLDGINAAVSQHGEEIMHPKSVAQYRTLFVKPATSVGAAVLSLGHPVKDRQRQDERHSFGSTAWLDECDGVALRLVATSRPITKGRKGSSSLSVVKDRYGEVKKHGEPNTKKEAGWFFMGSFIVDDSAATDNAEQVWWHGATPPGSTASLVLPKPKLPGAGHQATDEDGEGAQEGSEGQESGVYEPDPKAVADEAAVLAALAKLRGEGKPANKRLMHQLVHVAKSRVDEAITRLVYTDRVLETDGPRGSKIYSLPSELPNTPVQAPWNAATVPHDQH